MFRASSVSSQRDVFSSVEQFLRESDQETLNDPNAWYNVFLDQVTNGIDEERFRPLFDEENGRPNAPIRLLVGMLILKAGRVDLLPVQAAFVSLPAGDREQPGV